MFRHIYIYIYIYIYIQDIIFIRHNSFTSNLYRLLQVTNILIYCVDCFSILQATDVYIDFGCRLRITWAWYLIIHCSLESSLRIMVNWLHARGHQEQCEAVNSARHDLDAALRIGEYIKQLWSMLKVKSLQYFLNNNNKEVL